MRMEEEGERKEEREDGRETEDEKGRRESTQHTTDARSMMWGWDEGRMGMRSGRSWDADGMERRGEERRQEDEWNGAEDGEGLLRENGKAEWPGGGGWTEVGGDGMSGDAHAGTQTIG